MNILMEIQNWKILLSATLIGIFTAWGLIKILSILSRKPDRTILIKIRESITQVLYFFFPSLLITIGLGALGDESGAKTSILFIASKIMLVGLSTWLAIRVVIIFEKLFLGQLDLKKINNNQERKLFTKIKFIKRLVIIFILILSGSLLLLSFEAGRKFGLGILTSAGIVSVIVGFAAQKSIANLLAGIQIAFTQPIKIEDVVIVEGEWGRIEEINLTYVVVVIWDLRRMVLYPTIFRF
jgi:small-conductance mechanosensitive channel